VSSIAGSWCPRPGVFLDPRRAAFLSGPRLLLLSDLHVGFAWTQRQRGQLLPLDTPDDTPQRLADLCRDWQPAGVIVLGDFVHGAAPIEGIRREIESVLAAVPVTAPVRIVLGNHDVRLADQLIRWGIELPCVRQHEIDDFILTHGDEPAQPSRTGLFHIQGHEHPAIEIPDPPAQRVRVPAFLVSDTTLILPAFSGWAAGSVLGRRPFLSPWTDSTTLHSAVACLGSRLLPVPMATLAAWDQSPR
jgi:metallophosphoesterase superfamily enzyme